MNNNNISKKILVVNSNHLKPSGLDGLVYDGFIVDEVFGINDSKEYLNKNFEFVELIVLDSKLSSEDKEEMIDFVKESEVISNVPVLVENMKKADRVISVFTYQSMLKEDFFIDEDFWNARKRKIAISGHLDEAINDKEIVMWLQPQYNHTTGELIGVEALCRWNHKYLGFLQPDEFIKILEEDDHIFELDTYMWELACNYIRKWMDEGYGVPISVNVSRKDITKTNLVDHFLNLVKKYDIPPEMLRLEITEGAYMEDGYKIAELVSELKNNGFVVEMDDFGSGYSSLSMLQDVPVDILKLDMGFLRRTEKKVRGGNIVNAIIKMAHALDIGVVAEGVETIEQANFLKNLGCAYMQGYYFSKPIPVDEFEDKYLKNEIVDLKKQYDKYDFYQLQELLDAHSNSSFIFNYCMGPAALFEYNGKTAQMIIINDAVYELFGTKRSEFEKYRVDIFRIFSADTAKDIKCMFEKAIAEGHASTEILTPTNKKYIEINTKLISSSENAYLLITEMGDVTRERKLAKELESLKREIQAKENDGREN